MECKEKPKYGEMIFVDGQPVTFHSERIFSDPLKKDVVMYMDNRRQIYFHRIDSTREGDRVSYRKVGEPINIVKPGELNHDFFELVWSIRRNNNWTREKILDIIRANGGRLDLAA